MLLGYMLFWLLFFWVAWFYNATIYVWLATWLILSITGWQLLIISTLAFAWLCFCNLLLLGIAIRPLRYHYFTKKILATLKQSMPKISRTEAEAIAAGDVWLDQTIMTADLNVATSTAITLPELAPAEQQFLNQQLVQLLAMLDNWQITHELYDLPPEVWDFLKTERFFAITIPKQYGGLEFSTNTQSNIVAAIATRSATAAVTVMVPNTLGPAELLLKYGTTAQKNYYLPRLATGVDIPCFALTSTVAGSDAASMVDEGIICRGQWQNTEIIGIKLNFSKRYITLAPIATLIGLAFKLYDPDRLLGGQQDLGITLTIMPADHPGIERGARHYPLYTPFQNGTLSGKDVFIPLDNIIGGQDYIGKGWQMLMESLAGGRSISLPALSVGCTELALFTSTVYAQIRMQFKQPLMKFDGIRVKLGELTGLCYLLNVIRHVATAQLDKHMRPSVISAICKYHMTEISQIAMHYAMDIHGGKAIMLGPNNYLAQTFVTGPIAITVEGANILTRCLIIFGQGVIRAHPYLLTEINCLEKITDVNNIDRAQGLAFDNYLFKHIGRVFALITRAATYNLQAIYRWWQRKRQPLTAAVYDIQRLANNFALITEFALLFLGGKLKQKEMLSARLGDTMSYIFFAIATLQYSKQANTTKIMQLTTEQINILTNWNIRYACAHAERALMDFLRNFQPTWLATMLRYTTYPWGQSNLPVTDAMNFTNSELLQQPDFLLQLTPHLCLQSQTYNAQDNLTKLYEVLQVLPKFMAMVQKLQHHNINYSAALSGDIDDAVLQTILPDQELASWNQYRQLIMQILAVDVFTKLPPED